MTFINNLEQLLFYKNIGIRLLFFYEMNTKYNVLNNQSNIYEITNNDSLYNIFLVIMDKNNNNANINSFYLNNISSCFPTVD